MAACKKCGLPLRFVERSYGAAMKLTPVNPDGSDHWPTCRQNRLPAKPPDPPPECACGDSAPELRRCSANGAVCWQCASCGKKLTQWLPRSELGGVEIDKLPEYER